MIGRFGGGFLGSFLIVTCLAANVSGAAAQNLTACAIVNGEVAQKFIGGPLDVREQAKVPIDNAPGAYNSICTYIARGLEVDKALTAPRLLDLTLHFLDTPESMAKIYENTVIGYSQLAGKSDERFRNSAIGFLSGFGDKAFVFEAVTDARSGYRSALIVFYKGRIGGSIAAWQQPEPAVETSKAVLQYILSRLP